METLRKLIESHSSAPALQRRAFNTVSEGCSFLPLLHGGKG